jgi:7-carboxy-7-deazaguanine synthase
MPLTLQVAEIFKSVQGESSRAGLPCVFIRLTGCNLRCVYCDTTYAYDFGVEMSIDDIVATVDRFGLELVELTGGEPLLQPNVIELIDRFIDKGFQTMIETNGSVSLRGVNPNAIVIMDVKTPGSGMAGQMRLDNLRLLKPTDEIKFVLTNRSDYEWSKQFIEEHRLIKKYGLLFSPAYGVLEPQALVGWMLKDNFPARLNVQLHRYFWTERQGRGAI